MEKQNNQNSRPTNKPKEIEKPQKWVQISISKLTGG
jgi:hypothetical protein